MKKNILFILFTFISMLSCQQDIPMVSLGIDNVYAIERMKALVLHPEFPGERYEWSMKDSKGNDSLVSTDQDYIFLSATT